MPPKKKAEPRKGKTLQKHNAKMHKLVKPKKQAKPKVETAPKKVASKKAPTGGTINNFYLGDSRGRDRNVSYSEFADKMHRPVESQQSRSNAQRQQLPDGYVLVERAPATRTVGVNTPAAPQLISFTTPASAPAVNSIGVNTSSASIPARPALGSTEDRQNKAAAKERAIRATLRPTVITPAKPPPNNTVIIKRMKARVASELQRLDELKASNNSQLTDEQINRMRPTHDASRGNVSIGRNPGSDTSGDRVKYAESYTGHQFDFANRQTPSEIERLVEFGERERPRTHAGQAAYEREYEMRPVGPSNLTEGLGVINNPSQPPLTGVHMFVGEDASGGERA